MFLRSRGVPSDVVLGAQEANSSPPQNANRTLLRGSSSSRGELLGDLEDGRDAGAVVVDAGSLGDGVEVGAEQDGRSARPPLVSARTFAVSKVLNSAVVCMCRITGTAFGSRVSSTSSAPIA